MMRHNHEANARGPTPVRATTPPMTSTSSTWACPMHPEVRSERPGACPTCGMRLAPIGTSHEPSARHAREHGASELMMPAEILILDKMPMLGSGKVDLMTLAKLLQERAAEAAQPAVVA